jgi:hypothetical protein
VAAEELSSFLAVEDLPWQAGSATVSREVRDLIRTMSRADPLWGAPRIHGELLKLGIEISEPTVAKYMVRSPFPKPRSPSASQNQPIELLDTMAAEY